jgi:hypothetical protein
LVNSDGSSAFSFAADDPAGGADLRQVEFLLMKQLDIVTIVVTYLEGVEKVEIPIDVSVITKRVLPHFR